MFAEKPKLKINSICFWIYSLDGAGCPGNLLSNPNTLETDIDCFHKNDRDLLPPDTGDHHKGADD